MFNQGLIVNHCVSLFLDLSKAFDTVDHATLFQRLVYIGFSHHTIGWFINYFSDRTQATKLEGLEFKFA